MFSSVLGLAAFATGARLRIIAMGLRQNLGHGARAVDGGVVVLPRRHSRRWNADRMGELLAAPAEPEALGTKGVTTHQC
jgi:hypothetical protein